MISDLVIRLGPFYCTPSGLTFVTRCGVSMCYNSDIDIPGDLLIKVDFSDYLSYTSSLTASQHFTYFSHL